jgi:hypothetical protein
MAPGLLPKRSLIDHIKQIAGVAEALIDRLRQLLRWRRYRCAEVQQQDGVDLCDFLGRSIIALHQSLAGAAGGCGLETQLFCERSLVIEEEAIFASVDVQVQTGSQTLQETHAALQLLLLRRGDETVLGQIFPGISIACGAGNPQDRLQIAQTPRCLLAVGFEAVR